MNFESKFWKQAKIKHSKLDDKLLAMSPRKAVQFLINHKKLTNKPSKIQFSTVTALAARGYKKQMRKLFLDKNYLIGIPYTNQQPDKFNMFLKGVVGVLGLQFGAKQYHKITELRKKIDEISSLNSDTVQENMVMKLTRQNQLQQVDDIIGELEQNLQNISQRLMKQAFDLKSTINFSLKHSSRQLNELSDEEKNDKNNLSENNAEKPKKI